MFISIRPRKEKTPIIINDVDRPNAVIGSIGRGTLISRVRIVISSDKECANLQIGNWCSLGTDVVAMINFNHDYKSVSSSNEFYSETSRKLVRRGEILVGHDVWIGDNVVLMSGHRIGSGAVIGVNSVVTKDIPPYTIAAGNPIKIIKNRFPQEQIEKLLHIKWYEWSNEQIEERKQCLLLEVDDFIKKFYLPHPHEIQPFEINKKSRSFLFYPDFDDPYPIWQKVLTEYISKFSISDETTLILRINSDVNFERNIQAIQDFLSRNKKDKLNPDILCLIVKDFGNEWVIFKTVDYFITTRSENTISLSEIADYTHTKILSGVDKPIFNTAIGTGF